MFITFQYRSLQYLDLRALHSSNLTRTTYEYDLSHLNRYILYTKQSHCSPALSPLCNNDVSTGSKIVEWKPSYELEASNATFEYNSTDMECSEVSANHKRSIAVVEIPQPVDELADEARVVNTEKVERSLLNDLDDFSDIETEDLEDYTSPATCLLSNQYYHIWKGTHFYSRSHLLLPSDGVIWDPVHNHQPLMDHTYSGQSAYYRNWTKPEGKDLCMTLDSLVKLQVNEVKMRFLLSGPSSVSSTYSIDFTWHFHFFSKSQFNACLYEYCSLVVLTSGEACTCIIVCHFLLHVKMNLIIDFRLTTVVVVVVIN